MSGRFTELPTMCTLFSSASFWEGEGGEEEEEGDLGKDQRRWLGHLREKTYSNL
jgi:hypothetical protein